MASSSVGNSHRGNDSAEYQVVRSYLGPLVENIQHVLPSMANELFSKKLISKFERTNAIDNNQPRYDRASVMMDSVLTKIEANNSWFDVLLETLHAAELDSLVQDLERALKEKKAHCTTVSYGIIPQNTVTASNTEAVFPTVSSAINNVRVTTDCSPVQATYCYTTLTSGPTTHHMAQFSISYSDTMLVPKGNAEESFYKPSGDNSFAASDNFDSSTDLQPMETSDISMPLQSSVGERRSDPMPSTHFGNISTSLSNDFLSYSSHKFNTSINSQLSCPSLRQLSSGWSGQSLYKSSPVVGNEFYICVNPGLPPARNPLIDAFSTPLLGPVKLVHTQRKSILQSFEPSIPTPLEENDSSDVTIPIQSTQSAEDEMGQMELASYHKNSATNGGHSVGKRGSLQSSCFCHFKIQILRNKLDNRMSEIDILKNEIGILEKSFDEERKRMSEALREQKQWRAQCEKINNTLKEDIAFKNQLLEKFSNEKAKYEREIVELKKCCQNAEEKQWITERKADFAVARSVAKERETQALEKSLLEAQQRVSTLEKELKEAQEREAKTKRECFEIRSKTLQSEAVANIGAHIAEKNSKARSTLAPKLKLRAEREGKKAASENDLARAKEAEELAEKAGRLLYISKPASQLSNPGCESGAADIKNS